MTAFPSFPRLSGFDLASRPHEVAHVVGQDAASELVSLDTSGAEYYPTAVEKVDTDRLGELRSRVVGIARRHGFPEKSTVDVATELTFDQALAIELSALVDMSPYEASQRAVWAFLATRVLPDVVLWRYPATSDGNHVTPSNRVDGYKEDRRGVLRQAWWRGYILGPDLVRAIQREDDFVQLIDRTGITRNPKVARIIAEQHVLRLAESTYERSREKFQTAIKRVLRLAGRLSLEALPTSVLQELIAQEFEVAAKSGTSGGGTDTVAQSALASPSVQKPVEDPIKLFLGALRPDIRTLAEPLLAETPIVELDAAEALSYRAKVHARHLGTRLAARIAEELNSLVDVWEYLRPTEHQVVFIALSYFLDAEDLKPDSYPGGLEDDDHVVGAAFQALGRQRRGH